MFFKRKSKEFTVLAPTKGKIVPITEVPDPTFGEKMLGDGFAVIPKDGNFCAPFDGVIESMFDTGHAFALTAPNECSALIHIGLDTVGLEGRGFTILKKEGDTVKAGETIVQVDLSVIAEAGLNPITPVVFLNPDKMNQFSLTCDGATITLP